MGFSTRGENFVVSDLIVRIVDESDFGGFRCIAENDVGLSVKSIELEKREETSTSTILYVAIGILFTVILILVASLVFMFNKKTQKPEAEVKTSPTAKNRFSQPDLLNNNDNLIRDLLSTRNKGVDENSRNILNQTTPYQSCSAPVSRSSP